MIFFVANDGTVIKSVPSPVYQGSANANNIYLVAPFAANLSVSVAFKLPNGVWTTRYLMTPIAEISGVINEQTGKPYVGWQFSMPNEITRYFGTVTAQFFFYSAQGGFVTASSSTSFTIGQGVPEVLPDQPAADVYELILNNISALQQQLNNGTFTARSIYAWNSTYTYGAGEIVFYPDKGEYGVFIKSLVADNKAEPYINGVLNGESWQEVADFNIINELYTVRGDVAKLAQEAAESAEAAEQTVLNGKNDIQNIISDGQENIEQIISAGKESVEATAFRSAQSADEAAKSAQSAEGSKTTAEEANQMAQSWAERAREYAQFGIKINTDYQSVDELPTEGNPQFIYLIPNGSTGNNSYDEYMWVTDKNAYEKIGTTEIDLTAYVPKSGAVMTGTLAMPKLKVDKIARNEADSIYIEPKVTMHSQTTFENQINVGINGSDCYLYNDKDGNYNHSGDGQLASHLVIRADGGVTVRGSETAEETIDFNVLGELKEKGQRVYSPNNHDETKVNKSRDTMTGELTNVYRQNVRGYKGVDSGATLTTERSGFYSNAYTSSSKYINVGEGRDKFMIGYEYNDRHVHARAVYNGEEIFNLRFLGYNGALYDMGGRVYSSKNKPAIGDVGITFSTIYNSPYLNIHNTNGNSNLRFIWGFATAANGTHTINFSNPFLRETFSIQYSRETGTYDWDKSIITNMTRTGFTIRNDANPFVCMYFAIGY